MKARFSKGDRVSVAEAYHWARGVHGTIGEPPAEVVALSDGWQGVYRMVDTTHGPQSHFWVTFDTPQRDAEGDGPYDGAEMPADALMSV